MIPTINLDDRTFDDIKDEAIRLIPRYCPEWTNHNESDPGITLIELFSWMTEMMLYRLNKVPQKNYLSMLELMGLSLSTPQCSRTIIQFFPVENCNKNIFLRKGVKVGSVLDGTHSVVFETENDSIIRDLKIVSCINRTEETYLEVVNSEGKINNFYLFETENEINHILYISSETFKYLTQGHSIQLSFDAECEIVSVEDEIINHLYFEYWNGKNWLEIDNKSSIKNIKHKDNVIFLNGPINLEKTIINGIEGFFIRACLSDIPSKKNITKIKNINLRCIFEGEGFIPDICIKSSNNSYDVLDFNNDFKLFSDNPSYNEIFYIAADDIFSNFDSKVSILFSFSDVYIPEKENDAACFTYEYWNGSDWLKINKNFVDGTQNFKQSGIVSFKIPKNIKKNNINNEEHYYIRIRLITKDFSVGGVYVQDENGIYQWKFNSKVQSPLLNKIRISYEAPYLYPDNIFSNSSFQWNVFSSLTSKNENSIQLFNIQREHLPSLYIGFSKTITSGEFSLYFNIENKDSSSLDFNNSNLNLLNKINKNKRSVSLIWEYWNGECWKNLDFSDYTDSFHNSGFVKFIIPNDITTHNLFEKQLCWLRCVKLNGSFEKVPVILDILQNCVYAINADTYKNEILGSGNGGPNQKFRLTHTDILPGLTLVVNEGSIPSKNEINKMKNDGIMEPYTLTEDEVWVSYKEVKNFYNSDSFSRHFIIDYSTGDVIFGDGIHGINPPKGKFNIKVKEYKVGGGIKGNITNNKLQFLTQSIPYISGCNNPLPAEGGADMETVEELKSRAVGIFKSLNRAVTREDFEWLSCEASSAVGRAHCLNNKTIDGKIRTIIIPRINKNIFQHEKLIPSKELIRRVKNYLDDRKMLGTSILVTGPVYRNFNLSIELLFKNNITNSEYEINQIKEKLLIFFNPILGGDGNGTQFGKPVTKGMVLKTLENQYSILTINKINITDNDANVFVETLLLQEDEIPFLEKIEIIEKRG